MSRPFQPMDEHTLALDMMGGTLRLLQRRLEGALRRQVICQRCERAEDAVTQLTAELETERRLRMELGALLRQRSQELVAEVARRTRP